MRRTLIAALIAAAIPTFAAAQTIDERQDNLFRRIDQGVASGALTREEGRRLRDQFHEIARLERQYRYDGLSPWERQDLNRRFDDLSRRIDAERGDTERSAQGLYERRARLEQNIRDGMRGGGLTRRESDDLWRELEAFDQQMRYFQRSGDGLDRREREELGRRLERLANRILAERRDREQSGRNGRYPY